jgi:hypothetical protein
MGQGSWAKITSSGGQAYSTGVPTDQKSKQSWATNPSLHKHCHLSWTQKETCLVECKSIFAKIQVRVKQWH